MADELETLAQNGPETATAPEQEQDETTRLPETTDQVEGEPGDDLENPPEDEFEEFEWEGKQIKAPKGLKDGVLRQADYTRKTQEVAATKRELETRAQALAQQSELAEAEFAMRADLHQIDRELQRLSQLDWNAAYDRDFIEAQKQRTRFDDLRNVKAQLTQHLETQAQQRTQQAERELVTRLEETQRYAEKNIKGWTPEIDAKVMEFVTRDLKADWGALRRQISPEFYHGMYLAYVGHQALTKQAAPATPKPAPAPLQTVSSKANPTARKSFDEMNMDEYVAARKAGRG
jgi:hypothetical protein